MADSRVEQMLQKRRESEASKRKKAKVRILCSECQTDVSDVHRPGMCDVVLGTIRREFPTPLDVVGGGAVQL